MPYTSAACTPILEARIEKGRRVGVTKIAGEIAGGIADGVNGITRTVGAVTETVTAPFSDQVIRARCHGAEPCGQDSVHHLAGCEPAQSQPHAAVSGGGLGADHSGFFTAAAGRYGHAI